MTYEQFFHDISLLAGFLGAGSVEVVGFPRLIAEDRQTF
jgi:hypothetical protein